MYLDSSILLKLVVREDDSLFYADLVAGDTNAWSSELAMTECWSGLCRRLTEGSITEPERRQSWRILEGYVNDGSLRLQPVTGPVLRMANRLMDSVRQQVPVRTLDAIHLATCEFTGVAPLVTGDRVMRDAAEILGLMLASLPAVGRKN